MCAGKGPQRRAPATHAATVLPPATPAEWSASYPCYWLILLIDVVSCCFRLATHADPVLLLLSLAAAALLQATFAEAVFLSATSAAVHPVPATPSEASFPQLLPLELMSC
jgi:hypothetical protein